LPGRVVLVDGDIAETAPSYVNASPGFKISLLHLDLDAAARYLLLHHILYIYIYI